LDKTGFFSAGGPKPGAPEGAAFGSSEQAASIEETGASLEEMASMTQKMPITPAEQTI